MRLYCVRQCGVGSTLSLTGCHIPDEPRCWNRNMNMAERSSVLTISSLYSGEHGELL